MNPVNQSLTKVCANCGQQKPLSAFLQLSGNEGTIYSNICATCRKTLLTNPKEQEKEDSTKSTIGNKIDAKTKVQAEIDKRSLRKEMEESNQEEKHKKEKIFFKQQEKNDNIAEEEKSHRKNYLEKSSFLQTKKTSVPDNQSVHGGEKQSAKERRMDFIAPFRDTEIVGKLKYTQNPIFKQFKQWMGGTAAISSHEVKEKNKKENPEKKETPAEFVRKTWGKKP